jgi:hypothetical protein
VSRVRRFLHESSLSLFFGLIFLLTLFAQAFSGLAEINAEQRANGLGSLTWLQYVTSADYAADVTENWQSEFLQFLLYVAATVWLVQRGASESKSLDEAGLESDRDQLVGRFARPDSPAWAKAGGARTAVYSWSLTLMMGLVFLGCWSVQLVAGWAALNETRLESLQSPLTWTGYLHAPDFWNRSVQNWQSEFLAVGAMAAFSVFLRQRGSPESKPVGQSHEFTGT